MPAPPNARYIYVVTRRDLPDPHRTVQVAHAIHAAANTFGTQPTRTHPHLIVCAVETEADLSEAFNCLKDAGVPCCAYHEPDFGNAMTAMATVPLQGEQRKLLRRFRLL